jgi:LacI family gluconate utilization system Gnt-I transcriptional repressor
VDQFSGGGPLRVCTLTLHMPNESSFGNYREASVEQLTIRSLDGDQLGVDNKLCLRFGQVSINGQGLMQHRTGKSATIRDVAKAAGVSPITASRAMQGSDLVRPGTREKVVQAARKLDYIPNLAAGTLSTNASHLVAVILPNMSNSIFADTLQSISDNLRNSGYQLLVGYSDNSPDLEESLVRTFLSRRVDAIVLTGHVHNAQTHALLRRADVPIVEMWSLSNEPLGTCVGISNFDAAYSMTRYLLSKRHRNIGFIGGLLTNNDRTQSRLDGYRSALQDSGVAIDPNLIKEVPFEFEDGSRAMRELISLQVTLDAVFAASDILALGALLECNRQNLAVPGDMAVAGFDDERLASLIKPSLTTIGVPRRAIGEKVASVVLAALNGQNENQTVFDMGFTLVERESA